MNRRRLELLLAFLLPFLVALCFAHKPVHQDDWAYLRAAAYIAEDPGSALEKTTLYQGMTITVAQGVLHGPVWMRVLAICLWFGKSAPFVAHLFSSLCLGLIGLSMASLAGRFGAPRLSTGLLVALSPVPLVLAGNIMTDLPMLALFCASLATAARGFAKADLRCLVAAGLLGAAASLTRYHGLAILPMLAAMPVLWPRDRARLGTLKALVPFGLATLIVAAFLLKTSLAQGEADASRATSALLELSEIDRAACFLVSLAGMGGTLLALVIGWLAAPKRLVAALKGPVGIGVLVIAIAGGVGASIFAEGRAGVQPSDLNLLLQRLLLGLGVLGFLLAAVVVLCGRREVDGGGVVDAPSTWRERHGREVLLLCWLGGYFVAAWVTVPFGSTRYALPVMPALVLFGAVFATRHLGVRAVHAAVLPMALVGLGSAVAALRAAQVYPAFAAERAAARAAGQPHAQGNLWIWGELDFRWYLEEEPGLQAANAAPRPVDYLDKQSPKEPATTPPRVLGREGRETGVPVAGDHIIRSGVCTSSPDGLSGIYRLPAALMNRKKNAWTSAPKQDPWPIRIHNNYAAAGFYHADGGILPFAFSTVPHDSIQVFKVIDLAPLLTSAEHVLAGKPRTGGPKVTVQATPKPVREGGNVRIEDFLVYGAVELGIEQKSALAIFFPGRVTWSELQVPSTASYLEFEVAEHDWAAQLDGPGALLRVRINGEVAWELAVDARRNEGQRRWIPAAVDLRPYAGRAIELSVEAAEGSWPTKPAELQNPPHLYAGFAGLTIK
ncbi:MAG: hypothetical protein P1V81_15080 [Planctomycetota bacterium]|nr:hypothetical protein [Planctomycetota bacterium]